MDPVPASDSPVVYYQCGGEPGTHALDYLLMISLTHSLIPIDYSLTLIAIDWLLTDSLSITHSITYSLNHRYLLLIYLLVAVDDSLSRSQISSIYSWLADLLFFLSFFLFHRKLIGCGTQISLKKEDPIRCRECGYRILYKVRTTNMVQWQAR